MINLLILSLAISQVSGLTIPERSTEIEPLFVKVQGPDGQDVFEPYQRFNFSQWKPDSTLYEGVPMVEKQMVVDGKTVTYQDFNISALTLEQFKTHIMSGPDFRDSDGNLIVSDEAAQKYRQSMIAAEKDENANISLPLDLFKRDDAPGLDCGDSQLFCKGDCIRYVQRGVLQSTNPNVYGFYHYDSDSFCGTGSISKTVSVSHVSSITIGGGGLIPSFGKGWTKAVSTFFNTFGINIGHVPNSVSTSIGYSGTCGPHNVCFLWHRPHFTVRKGVVVTQFIDLNTGKTCQKTQSTPFEAHIVHTESDPGGAASHGICYSMASHGCPNPIQSSSTLTRCPNGF